MPSYFHKYIKYKKKYINLKQLGGGLPDWANRFFDNLFEVIPKLNSQFITTDEYPLYFWKLTGSASIILLAYSQNPELLNSLDEPNDIDIIVYQPNVEHIPYIAGRTSSQTSTSATYTKEGLISIDTTNIISTRRTSSTKYIYMNLKHPYKDETIEINLNLISTMLSDYLDTVEARTDINKINYLKTINNSMFDIKTVNFREPIMSADEGISGMLLF